MSVASRADAWRHELAVALGTSMPLARTTSRSLTRVIDHFNESDDPDAWVWATICGAELVRRRSPYHQTAAGRELNATLKRLGKRVMV